jgi:hypothetical protein
MDPANESVEKALLESENKIFGVQLTLPKHEIVDCGAFCARLKRKSAWGLFLQTQRLRSPHRGPPQTPKDG